MSLDAFPPFISAQLRYLLDHSPHLIKVEQAWSGNKYYPGVLDRFTLIIPYCLDFIKWHFVYNTEFPSVAPDVIFGPDDEDFHPFHEFGDQGGGLNVRAVKSTLSDWNHKDPSQLLALIEELREKYRLYQTKRVGEVDDNRLKFEISTVLSREGIEMLMNSIGEKAEEVKFAVPLMDVDINKMVLACPWKHRQKIYLQVVYPVGRKYTSSPSAPRLKLMSTPELKALFFIEDVKLPSWVDGMCLAEYLPHLEELLHRQVKEAVSMIDIRRHFIEASVPQFGRPLEADPVFCRKATFLAASGPFTFLVHFSLSPQFPKQQPCIMLQSIQHFNSHGVPVKTLPLTEYPWSPRWEASLMAERIYDFLVDESLNFKRSCNEPQQQH